MRQLVVGALVKVAIIGVFVGHMVYLADVLLACSEADPLCLSNCILQTPTHSLT